MNDDCGLHNLPPRGKRYRYFHGTTPQWANQILESGVITQGSITKNAKQACWYMKANAEPLSGIGAVVVIDTDKDYGVGESFGKMYNNAAGNFTDDELKVYRRRFRLEDIAPIHSSDAKGFVEHYTKLRKKYRYGKAKVKQDD